MTCYDYILFVLRVVYNVVVLFWVESVGDQIYPLSLFFFFLCSFYRVFLFHDACID